MIWHNPRFEAPGKPTLLLRNYPQYGTAYETSFSSVFSETARYLEASAEASRSSNLSLEEIAKKEGLDPTFLQRWSETLSLEPRTRERGSDSPLRVVSATPLELLKEKVPKDNNRPAINGWRKQGTALPAVLSNASDTTEHIPGTAEPHSVVVHPTPSEFVGVAWRSPIAGRVRIHSHIKHAHPNCGNGVAWRLDHRHGAQAAALAEGLLE